MSESVLERSVLERKERDELQTIARAMGIEPASRARKAELVDMILSTAGIGPAANGGEASPAP
ncbi:MAG: Rho termination factor N-terminal domain-containing protein, partial [Actinobacteria bacterium]|nr:Rho termination factor N-terminal domain-containing protein [Actinomycetota bacterium]